MIKDFWILAIKNLKRRGLRSWLTLLGIFIGVTAVITLISLGDGLKLAVNSQFGVSSTQLLTIQAGGISGMGPPGSFVVNSLTSEDSEAIEKLSTVEIAIPRIIKYLKTEFNNKLQMVATASVPEDKAQDIYELKELEAQYGRLIEKGDIKKIVVGNNFANKDKNGFDKAIMPGTSVTINGKKFKVIGVLKKKGSFILDNAILMTEEDIKEAINDSNKVDVIIAKSTSKENINEAKEDIENLLRQRRDVKKGQEDFEVSTPEATLATVNQILTGVQLFIVLIAFMSILVGTIGIVNTMMISVMERRKEIGVMKAIGATNKNIFLQFLIEAGLLGLIGGLSGIIAGSILGYLGVLGINNFIGATVAPKINLTLIVSTLFGSFIIGSIAGILPAVKASKQNVIEVLRGQ